MKICQEFLHEDNLTSNTNKIFEKHDWHSCEEKHGKINYRKVTGKKEKCNSLEEKFSGKLLNKEFFEFFVGKFVDDLRDNYKNFKERFKIHHFRSHPSIFHTFDKTYLRNF
jgi:hypothetical protein